MAIPTWKYCWLVIKMIWNKKELYRLKKEKKWLYKMDSFLLKSMPKIMEKLRLLSKR